MKRSEMLDVIENVIDDLLIEGAFGKITDYNPTRENSIIADIRFGDVENRILKAIEEAGMLPPCVRGATHYDNDNYWEPEEENK